MKKEILRVAFVGIVCAALAQSAMATEVLYCAFPSRGGDRPSEDVYGVNGDTLQYRIGPALPGPGWFGPKMKILRNDKAGIVAADDMSGQHNLGAGVFIFDRETGEAVFQAGRIGDRVWKPDLGSCKVTQE